MRYFTLVFFFLFSIQSFSFLENKTNEIILDAVVNEKAGIFANFIPVEKIEKKKNKKRKKKAPNQIKKKKKGKKSKNKKSFNNCYRW